MSYSYSNIKLTVESMHFSVNLGCSGLVIFVLRVYSPGEGGLATQFSGSLP
jgi:hypothetical protein